jgi:ATP-dependent DNA helicase RecQ
VEAVARTEPESKAANGLSKTVNASLELRAGGMSADDIAERRGFTASTILGHFAEAIEAGHLEARDCVDLDEAEIDEILAAFEEHGTLESGKLGPVHAAFDGRHSYGVLKCLLAELA